MTEPQRRELTIEILRRTRDLDLTPLLDNELTSVAEESFLELDAREAANPRP